MARAMWRGAIQFGLVTIPIKLYLATESRGGLSFNLLHKECGQRIQMRVHCPEHGEIPRSETVRGFEYAKGQYVLIDEEDFENVPLKTVRSIEIDTFVEADRESHDQTFIRQAYYIEPEAVGRKAFYLLKSVLADEGLSAVCKIVLKDREQLASLNPFSNTMLLTTLYWPDEVRSLEDLDLPAKEPDFKPAEKQMAKQLIAAMRGEFEASEYRDEYREALMGVIEAKIAGQPAEAPRPVAAQPTRITDLMSVLEASVAAVRESRSARAPADAEDDAAEQPAAAKAARSGTRGRRAKATEEPEPLAARRKARTADKSSAKPAAKAATIRRQPAAAGRQERRRKTA
ncbi:MAG TPA: Ku protein [Candidatus Limnocylindrales bacterium]|nr:Ku protein [Candidatus Limnocylindrales bacterium]